MLFLGSFYYLLGAWCEADGDEAKALNRTERRAERVKPLPNPITQPV